MNSFEHDSPSHGKSDNPLVQSQPTQLPTQGAYMPPPSVWLDSANEEEGLNWIGLLHSFRRKWLPGALIGSVLATLVAGLMFLLIPVNHEAVALLRVRMSRLELLDNRTHLSSEREYGTYKQTQAALMASPYVLNAAIRSPEIQALGIISAEDHPVAYLEDELRVEFPGDSEILRVSLAAENDKEAIKVVDAVVRAYTEEIAQSERTDVTKRLDLLRATHRNNTRTIQEMTDDISRSWLQILAPSDSAQAEIKQKIAESELRNIETAERLQVENEFLNVGKLVSYMSSHDGSATFKERRIRQNLKSKTNSRTRPGVLRTSPGN